jgi:hypothetical protein
MFQQLVFHAQQNIQSTSVQDLDPCPSTDNTHSSDLTPHEMTVIEHGENSTRTLTWKLVVFLTHINCRTNDDRFPLPLGRLGSAQSSLGVPIPALIGPAQQCVSNVLHYHTYGDHLQTCQTQVTALQTHDWSMIGWVLCSVLWVTQLTGQPPSPISNFDHGFHNDTGSGVHTYSTPYWTTHKQKIRHYRSIYWKLNFELTRPNSIFAVNSGHFRSSV